MSHDISKEPASEPRREKANLILISRLRFRNQ
jgi:hypothetical protein